MPEPVIRYNASTGSDTAASGAGPATAIAGTGAAHTFGLTTTTITLDDAPDLSGVATDGSAAIWLATASGRRISKILGVTTGTKGAPSTVTVADSFTILDGGSAVDYAIGGKRQTLESAARRDHEDFKEGWTAEFDEGTYDLTGTWACPIVTTSGTGFDIRAAAGAATRPIIRNTATSSTFAMVQVETRTRISGIRFENASTSGSATNIILHNTSTRELGGLIVRDCELVASRSGSTGGYCFRNDNPIGTNGIFEDCLFSGAATGAHWVGGRCNIAFTRCRFTNCFYGCRVSGAGNNGCFVADHCIFDINASFGVWIAIQNTYSHHLRNCTFYDNGAGIFVQGNGTRWMDLTFCLFVENKGYAVDSGSSGVPRMFWNYCVFHANTSGLTDYTDEQLISGGTLLTGTDPLLHAPASGDFGIPHDSVAANVDGAGRYAGAIPPDDAPVATIACAF